MVDGSVDLARARLSDGEVAALTRTPERDETWPYWSELARRLAFQTGPIGERGASDLVAWLPNSGGEVALTETPQRSERWAAWSPTRRQLAFAFLGPANAGVAIYDFQIGGARLVTPLRRDEVYLRPSFAPDGGRLVAQRRGEGGRGSNLWLLQEGREPVRLTDEPQWFDIKAWFTRDARRIIYSRRPSGGDGWYEVVSLGIEARDLRVVARSEKADNHSARPSPLRDEIVFVSDRSGSFDVYLAGVDGENPRNISNTPGRDEFAPRWSPDGELVALTVATSEYGMPRLADRESLERARVVVLHRTGNEVFETAGFMPDWMPPW